MFLSNKYSKWYFNIISTASQEFDKRESGYYEKHHIIPKSLGGNNKKDNLVKLTAKEHFICHRLLVKMTTGKDKARMSCALYIFKKRNKYQEQIRINSFTYEKMRTLAAQALSLLNKGKIVSEDTRKKQSLSKRKTHNTPEFKLAASLRARNRTSEHKAKIGAKHKGKTISSEMKLKQSEKLSGSKNPRALSWKISFEDGSPEITITSLKTWCKEKRISYGMVFRTSQFNNFHKGIKATRLN